MLQLSVLDHRSPAIREEMKALGLGPNPITVSIGAGMLIVFSLGVSSAVFSLLGQ
jgi:hypothetical protein